MSERSVVAWVDALADALATFDHAILAVVAAAKGSTPRDTGVAMVVTERDARGTIGGGHLEYETIRIARTLLAEGRGPGTFLIRFPLAASLGQCCGGVVTVAFARLDRAASAWLAPVQACARAAMPFALVSRVAPDTRASDRLVVTGDDVRGTFGDAALDSAALAAARARLAAGTDGASIVPREAEPESPLLVHVERAAAFPVLVFGNGHVGRALVEVLGVLPAQVKWVDARRDDFPARVPANVDVVVSEQPQDALDDAPRGAFVLVMTHSHALDYALIEAALARDDWRYLGLIGSESKRRQFERRLAARHFPPDALARVRCPIGAGAGIKAKHPGAIAVAVAAELLAVREASAAADARLGRPVDAIDKK
jgi:xanthine dehydrogenase accessory factor